MEQTTLHKSVNPDSVELNRTSKGWTFSVKCYGDFTSSKDTDRVLEQVKDIATMLDKKYKKEE